MILTMNIQKILFLKKYDGGVLTRLFLYVQNVKTEKARANLEGGKYEKQKDVFTAL